MTRDDPAMPIPKPITYRIAALRPCGSRDVLFRGLTHDEAGRLYWKLCIRHADSELLIEPDQTEDGGQSSTRIGKPERPDRETVTGAPVEASPQQTEMDADPRPEAGRHTDRFACVGGF
jgi:hypothetical protein